MKKYIFYDRDVTGIDANAEYGIVGEDFIELIDKCFEYSSILSLTIMEPEVSFLNELNKFAISKPINFSRKIMTIHVGRVFQPYEKCYRICPELHELMLKISDSLFEWIYGWGFTNPEDPVFYRKDGSVFFSSVVHEGECTLYPRDDEDVSNIVSKGNWIKYEE